MFIIRVHKLRGGLDRIAQSIDQLGVQMSALTDSVRDALEAFLANEADEDAALTAARATIVLLEQQIEDLGEGAVVNAENVAALEQVRDALLAQLPQEQPPVDPVPAEPTDEGE